MPSSLFPALPHLLVGESVVCMFLCTSFTTHLCILSLFAHLSFVLTIIRSNKTELEERDQLNCIKSKFKENIPNCVYDKFKKLNCNPGNEFSNNC